MFGNIGFWPYWSLAVLVLAILVMPNQMLDSRTKIELFGGCSPLWMQETFFYISTLGKRLKPDCRQNFWLRWRQNSVMIRYLWFDQWLAANRPMIMTNAWVTSREDGLRQVAKSRAAFYTRSRCLWPAWATLRSGNSVRLTIGKLDLAMVTELVKISFKAWVTPYSPWYFNTFSTV